MLAKLQEKGQYAYHECTGYSYYTATHSNLHLIRIVQEGERQYSNDGTKELCIGKEEKGCKNCNWI